MENLSSIKLLIIDLDKSFSKATSQSLKQMNSRFEVVVCNTAEEGLSYFESNDVDCILCGYELADWTGLEVLEEVRHLSSSVPFILFIENGTEMIAQKAFSNDATDYLQKSRSSEVQSFLASRIEKYVENERLHSRQQRILDEKNRLLNRVTDGFISFDEDFCILHLNSQGITFINDLVRDDFSYSDLIGEVLWDVIPKSSNGIFRGEFQEAVNSANESSFEVYYDEKEKWFNIRVFPSSDGISVFIQDITEVKKEKIERKKEIEVLFDLYDIANDNELTYDERLSKAVRLGRDFLSVSFGFITNISDGKQEIFLSEMTVEHPKLTAGAICPVEESYCQTVLEIDDIVSVTNASEGSIIGVEEYETFQLESYISQRVFVNNELFGTLCFADYAVREKEFSEVEVAIAELLSGWIGFEIERKFKQKEIENRNQRLDAFARFVSHDLRNPLSIAMGFCEIEQKQQGEENRNLQKIEKAHNRMDDIISELLEFARSSNELSDLSSLSISDLATEAWENIESQGSQLCIDSDFTVKGDSGKLLHVLENIMQNSIEHNTDSVTVTVGKLEDKVGFYIEDDGVGIKSDADLFVPDEGGETRFGLLITQEILQAHGWSIQQVDCSKGARFEILIED